jgi:hypothetical protein
MGLQRIDFGDVRHRRHKGRTDGTTRADEITVFLGLGDNFMGDIVVDRIAVIDDAVEFAIEPVFDVLRQRNTIPFVGVLKHKVRKKLFRSRIFRGIKFAFDGKISLMEAAMAFVFLTTISLAFSSPRKQKSLSISRVER